jgi:hypothetical protein
MLIVRITLLAAVCVMSGCSAASSSGGPGSLTPASIQPSEIPAVEPSGSIDLPTSVIDPVVAEVARLASVPVNEVTVISAEEVTFPDGSLGCPQPGMSYTQALVDGYKIVAEAGGKMYDFRGSGSTFRLCTNPTGLTKRGIAQETVSFDS